MHLHHLEVATHAGRELSWSSGELAVAIFIGSNSVAGIVWAKRPPVKVVVTYSDGLSLMGSLTVSNESEPHHYGITQVAP